jgi:hypothetical protein
MLWFPFRRDIINMAKKSEMDQTTKDAIAADKAGMSYGQWIAIHKPPQKKPVKQVNEEGCPVCKVCGKVMVNVRKNRMYCSHDCYAIAMSARARDRYRKKVTQCG